MKLPRDLRSILTSGLAVLVGVMLGASSEAAAAEDCAQCHVKEAKLWAHSDHAWSMRLPTQDSVKAPFAGEEANFAGLLGRFERISEVAETAKDDIVPGASVYTGRSQFLVRLKDADANEVEFTDYNVQYTFGHDPLQQFLIGLNDERLQVAPFAYDTRPASDGGQRWIHLEAAFGESREPRFAWHQPLQNWNGMCADCHSRGLRRNYEPTKDHFNTVFSAVNVDCLSCHTVAQNHSSASPLDLKSEGGWVRGAQDPVAHWTGPKREAGAMDACFACHSLRTPLTDGFIAAAPFLDQFRPEMVIPPFYQADGQIEEEVYVYGSFLQSAMYEAGVQCVDCHDPHSGQVKAKGNTLCVTCHSSDVFDSPTHHQHQVDSVAGQCVSCHMPAKTYMSIDDRRDHRFAVPDPELASILGSDDVCQSCHEDRWAQFKKMPNPNRMALLKTRQPDLTLFQPQQGERVLAMLNQSEQPAILRASMLRKYAASGGHDLSPLLTEAAQSREPLLRLAATDLLDSRFLNQKQLLIALARDSLRSVRVAAIDRLRAGQIDIEPNLASAEREADVALDQIAWRGEGRLRLAELAAIKGESILAEHEFKRAIEQEPFFVGGYLNFADHYRRLNAQDESLNVLERGLRLNDKSAVLHYSRGLALVRLKRYRESKPALLRAVTLAPDNPDYLLAALLLLDALNERHVGIAMVQAQYPSAALPEAISQLLNRWGVPNR